MPNWDQTLTQELIGLGISWELARAAIGIIAEQRQIADRQGYTRGYNNGYAAALKLTPESDHGPIPDRR